MHNRPTISQTMLLKNMYQNPVVTAPLGPDGIPMQVDERTVQSNFEDFYEDVFEEVAQHGEVENLNVCDNIADHMVGNVYIKFKDEEAAAKALQVIRPAQCPLHLSVQVFTSDLPCRSSLHDVCTIMSKFFVTQHVNVSYAQHVTTSD
jgi:hypothetical protein